MIYRFKQSKQLFKLFYSYSFQQLQIFYLLGHVGDYVSFFYQSPLINMENCNTFNLIKEFNNLAAYLNYKVTKWENQEWQSNFQLQDYLLDHYTAHEQQSRNNQRGTSGIF